MIEWEIDIMGFRIEGELVVDSIVDVEKSMVGKEDERFDCLLRDCHYAC